MTCLECLQQTPKMHQDQVIACCDVESSLFLDVASAYIASADKLWVSVVLFRESVLVGYTSMTPQHVQQAVQEMGEQYKGNAYHLLQRNCNHFSNDLCRKLTGKEAPLWVSQLARTDSVFLLSIYLCMCQAAWHQLFLAGLAFSLAELHLSYLVFPVDTCALSNTHVMHCRSTGWLAWQ